MFSAIRPQRMLNSVRARLTFWYLLTLGGSLAAFAVFVFVVRAHTLYRELDADLTVGLHQLASDLRPSLLELDVAASLAGQPGAAGAPLLVRESRGPVLFRSRSFPDLDWADERRLAAAAREDTAVVTVSNGTVASLRVATLRVNRPGAESLVLQLAGSTAPVRHILRQLGGVMATAILLVLLLASYGSGFTARRALAPVDEIVVRVRHIQASRLGERLDVHAGSEELDRLVATLNEMLDRIEASVGGARRFAADASHELQTPLAAMRGAVEACLRANRPAADYRRLAGDLLVDLDRFSALIRDLRLLAIAGSGHLVASPAPVDMAAIVTECTEIARAIAEEKQIHVDVRIAARPTVTGSALHLRRVMLNLVENAVRYSPPHSVVQVGVGAANGRALVSVRDQGSGIAAADLPHIFEPFFRSDPARARETGGTGLGLAIADQIVRVHHGQIEVASTPGAGSTFTVHLPTASSAGAEVL
jgi:two-component system, OmpR family, sensor kinase